MVPHQQTKSLESFIIVAMVFLKSFVLAFSMFSKIPMPTVAWNKTNLRYMMCFFPFVGFLIGALAQAFFVLGRFFPSGSLCIPLALTLAPVLVTGGIHFDGFMDTCDALASHTSAEKKREIMKDSHVGAFAVLGAVLYLLSYFVLCVEMCRKIGVSDFSSASTGGIVLGGFLHGGALGAFSLSFALSRFLSALAVCVFPKAGGSGLLRTFSDSAALRFTLWWCVSFIALIFFCLVVFCGRFGKAVVVSGIVSFAWYFFMSRRNFGGITGDLAGWFVQICEIFCLLGVCIP